MNKPAPTGIGDVDGPPEPPVTSRAVELLESAHKAVVDASLPDDLLTRAALHLIECAADAVAGATNRDSAAAQAALSSARAAVLTATCAVRHLHNCARTEPSWATTSL